MGVAQHEGESACNDEHDDYDGQRVYPRSQIRQSEPTSLFQLVVILLVRLC
jgi:hypothetical protein